MANHLMSARNQLAKKAMEFAKSMDDRMVQAERKWKNGAGGNKDKYEYLYGELLSVVKEGFGTVTDYIKASNADMNSMGAKQMKQDVDITKAGQKALRVTTPIIEEIVTTNVAAAFDAEEQWYVEFAQSIRLLDPDLYTKNGRIFLSAFGLTPQVIMHNEFDLEVLAQKNTEFLADHRFLKERWGTFFNQTQKYVNCTMNEFIQGYIAKRGIPFTPAKRGRKTNSEVQV